MSCPGGEKKATQFTENTAPDLSRIVILSNPSTGEVERLTISELFDRLGITVTIGSGTTFADPIIVDDDTQSTSTTTGSIQTDGGLGVVKDAFFGNDAGIANDLSVGNDITVENDITILSKIIARNVSDDGFDIYADGSGNFIVDTEGGTERLRIRRTNGNMTVSSLGTGTVYSDSGVLTNTNPSDPSLKKIHGSYTRGIDDMKKMETILFNYLWDKEGHSERPGYDASKVQKIAPELVGTFIREEETEKVDEDGNKILKEVEKLGFKESVPNPWVANCLIELVGRVEELEEALASLSSK